MFTPGGKLRLDASGRLTSLGYTLRKLAAEGPTAVTFSTTADTPLAGTLPTPATFTSRVWFAPSGDWTLPVPFLVSRTRNGGSGLNFVCRAAVCTASAALSSPAPVNPSRPGGPISVAVSISNDRTLAPVRLGLTANSRAPSADTSGAAKLVPASGATPPPGVSARMSWAEVASPIPPGAAMSM